jgi:hypothetical protein
MASNLTDDQKNYYDTLKGFEKPIYLNRVEELNKLDTIFQKILNILKKSQRLLSHLNTLSKSPSKSTSKKHNKNLQKIRTKLEKFNNTEFTVWISNLDSKQEYPIYYSSYTVEELQKIHDQRLKQFEDFEKQISKYSKMKTSKTKHNTTHKSIKLNLKRKFNKTNKNK